MFKRVTCQQLSISQSINQSINQSIKRYWLPFIQVSAEAHKTNKNADNETPQKDFESKNNNKKQFKIIQLKKQKSINGIKHTNNIKGQIEFNPNYRFNEIMSINHT